MIENKKVISRSLIFLFLCLSLVYSLAYMKKTEIFKSVTKSWNEISDEIEIWDHKKGYSWLNEQSSIDLSNQWDASQNLSSNNTTPGFEDLYTNNQNTNIFEPSDSVSLASDDIELLPGTSEYFGTLDIIWILWEKPKYILQDSKWNYFAYYWDHLNFVDTVETLGWNVYEMVTESEILQNQLFGDRVSYINLSMFKDVRVIMVIKIDGDVRLLQIPSDKYHYSKDYLKSLFIH